MSQLIQSHQFENGLVLVCETMDWLESAAVSISLPAGGVRDPDDKLGLANFTCDMVQRGSGVLDSRAYAERLDRLGVDRGAAVTQAHTSFVGATLCQSIEGLLQAFGDMILQPHLPESQLEDARQVCLQELASLEDDLAQRTMERVRLLSYPQPWGRSPHGSVEAVNSIAQADVVHWHARHFVPDGTIISVAGKVEFSRIRDVLGQIVGDWKGTLPPVGEVPMPTNPMTISHMNRAKRRSRSLIRRSLIATRTIFNLEEPSVCSATE